MHKNQENTKAVPTEANSIKARWRQRKENEERRRRQRIK